jgi:hypothetical protein
MILGVYLSEDHLDNRAAGSCRVIAFPSDVSRDSTAVKGAFRHVLAMTVETFAANLGRSEKQRALGRAGARRDGGGGHGVSGMVPARAVDDVILAEELRSIARAQTTATVGWE